MATVDGEFRVKITRFTQPVFMTATVWLKNLDNPSRTCNLQFLTTSPG